MLVLCNSCGHKKAPTGGDKDLLKPEIVAVNPEEFSDISNSNPEFTFSKPMDRNTLAAGLYIYPPVLNKKFIWDGTELQVKIFEELLQETNYFFSFSTRIKGEHDNPLVQDYTFIFSSGRLNQQRISGEFTCESPDDIRAEKMIKLLSADTVLVFQKIVPEMYFELNNLNEQNHLLEVYIDKNENDRYDYSIEPFWKEIVPQAEFTSLIVHLAYQDTVKADLSQVQTLSNNQINVIFTEPVSDHGSFFLMTADSLELELPWQAYSLIDDRLSILTDVQDTLVYALKIRNFLDLKGNLTEEKEIRFKGVTRQDTLKPELLRSSPRNGETVAEIKPQIELLFSEIILLDQVDFTLTAVETGAVIPLKILQGNSEKYLFEPVNNLGNYSSYMLSLTGTDPNGNPFTELPEIRFITIIRS
ncbi:MAG: Ig-like domain-containing protein [Candidatus Cloacimonetes bacterium]|nr:Ig-like domain-containing protein [Candidatus Cloacimonadota bacterium]